MDGDLESQIHHFEKEAYSAVMRAFMAQGDAITWDKADLMTQLCQELRVSHDEYTDILSRVKEDNDIKRIREMRQSVGDQAATLNPSHTNLNTRGRKRSKTDIPRTDIHWVGENPSDFPTGGTGNKLPEDIEIFDTETVIKEVELVFSSSNPGPAEMELAKKKLREQEQALVDAISVLSTVTDSDEEPFPYERKQ